MQLSYNVDECIERCIAEFDPVLSGSSTPNDAKELACRAHMGYCDSGRLRNIILQGADWAVKHLEKGDTREMVGGWYHPLSRGMLLCLLTNDTLRLKRLCAWAKPTKKPEYKGPLEDEIQLLYLVLSSLFQTAPDKKFEMLRQKIAACRVRNVKLLSNALDAVINGDQQSFGKAIEEYIKYHKSKPKPAQDAYFMEDWLPLHANVIYLIGLQRGLKPPDYPPEIAAYLMTPETVGFGKTK